MGRTTYEAALVIGVDPLIAYTAPIQVPDGTNDFEVAGGLRGARTEGRIWPGLCLTRPRRDYWMPRLKLPEAGHDSREIDDLGLS
jgi:hypothetical protein